MKIHPLAGHPAPADLLVDVDALIAAYHDLSPDPHVPAERVSFGTSGHRGSSLDRSFNADHVLAITEAICRHRRGAGISGPLFLGIDTHALSRPAMESALEVLAAHGVDVMLAHNDGFTPTPAISHAILCHNRDRVDQLADGIVITPSHNPPADGGFKYNPPNGGPAESDITRGIEIEANRLLEDGLREVKRVSHAVARRATTTHEHDYVSRYVRDLGAVIDMDAIRASGVRIGVDPMGGAGVHYWRRIAEEYGIALTVVRESVDPTFRFMTLDWDGRIRMDPSSPYAMHSLLQIADQFDVAVACDTDHDRHGVVTPTSGLLPPNHYLAVMIEHLFTRRTEWPATAAVGKTVVSSSLIDCVAAAVGRPLYEVPVGFKWFAQGLFDGSLGFGGEESAGASFLRRDGTVWTTDKDGIVAALLAAEITAATGIDPGACYARLAESHGAPVSDRVEAPASRDQKTRLSTLGAAAIRDDTLAGDPIERVLSHAPGNGAPIGGIKVTTAHGWFAARPSGTEDIYKIYAESFRGRAHLDQVLAEAQRVVDAALDSPGSAG
ncbi:MAG TPA: phosphoglucomutase (alpha-D-glucose-1,6-bisphosphate-dependent) [Gemmatimonadales bacterium]|nr:phosphoglucomutase (alpha-D-glucose-1,6-bisphosphate-dependent) [Gemmatimonadales bacterium]